MLEGYSPVTQALLGTLFTWGLTAAGAALVFVFSSRQVLTVSVNNNYRASKEHNDIEQDGCLCLYVKVSTPLI